MNIRIPDLAEGVESGTVVKLLVSVGEKVKKGQSVLELETQKAVGVVPTPADGTVAKILVKEGDVVAVGQVVLALTESAGGSVDAPPAVRAPIVGIRRSRALESVAREASAEGEEDILELPSGAPPAAPPSVRRLAQQLGIDLRRIKGSERGGRITLEDVRAYIQRLEQRASGPRAIGSVSQRSPSESVDFSQWGPVTKKPITVLRRTISQKMVESWSTIPHVTQFAEADITDVMALRKKASPAYQAKGAHLTLTPLILKALVAALKKHPIFNSSFDEAAGEIVTKAYYHFGIAVDTEAGLIVPVIRNVDQKSLLEIALELQVLAEKARQRKVSLDDLRGGTFTISNQGGIGGAHFTPIINKPEAAILGIGQAAQKPAVKEGKVQARLLLPLGLSYDHRLIDGADAARFITDFIQVLERFKEGDIKL